MRASVRAVAVLVAMSTGCGRCGAPEQSVAPPRREEATGVVVPPAVDAGVSERLDAAVGRAIQAALPRAVSGDVFRLANGTCVSAPVGGRPSVVPCPDGG